MKNKILSILIVVVMVVPFFANAQEQGDLLVRLRLLGVLPNVEDNISGADVGINDAWIPELDISYFFTDNLAAELILGTNRHNVDLKAKSTGITELGDVELLPPTLTLQYHFNPQNALSFYVGAGLNYTLSINEDDATASEGIVDIDFEDSWGTALQAGFMYKINDKFHLNLDFKRVWINMDVTVWTGDSSAEIEIYNSTEVNVDIDPWLFGFGVGYTF